MPDPAALSNAAAPRFTRQKTFVLIYLGACYMFQGVHSDAFMSSFEQPYLESRNATLLQYSAAALVESFPGLLKPLLALPLDAGFCFSRIAAYTLGLRRPAIFIGQLLATVCFGLTVAIDPVSAPQLYQLVGFVRQLGVVLSLTAIEGYALDAGKSLFVGQETLPSMALNIGRMLLGGCFSTLVGGFLVETRGFGAMFAFFICLTAATIPMTFFAPELCELPAEKNSLRVLVASFFPVHLILAWISRKQVLVFLAIFGFACQSLQKKKPLRPARHNSQALNTLLQVANRIARARACCHRTYLPPPQFSEIRLLHFTELHSSSRRELRISLMSDSSARASSLL
jgi:hypothetical protein